MVVCVIVDYCCITYNVIIIDTISCYTHYVSAARPLYIITGLAFVLKCYQHLQTPKHFYVIQDNIMYLFSTKIFVKNKKIMYRQNKLATRYIGIVS